MYSITVIIRILYGLSNLLHCPLKFVVTFHRPGGGDLASPPSMYIMRAVVKTRTLRRILCSTAVTCGTRCWLPSSMGRSRTPDVELLRERRPLAGEQVEAQGSINMSWGVLQQFHRALERERRKRGSKGVQRLLAL